MPALPPGPRLPKVALTYRVLSDPLRWLPAWRDRYGDPFTIRAVNGDIVLTGNPDLIGEIFRAGPDAYAPFGTRAVEPLVGKGSIFNLEGAAHQRERKLIMPPFHGARMRAYADIMATAASRNLAATHAADGPVTAGKLMQAISLEVILRAVFGVDDDRELDRFGESVVAVVDAVHPAFLFMPFLQQELGGIGPYAKFRRLFEAQNALLLEQIDLRRRHPGDDILSLLVAARYEDGTAMDDETICGELRTLLVAGHETTAISLSWALDVVHRHPGVRERLLAEIDDLGPDPDPEALTKLPYLDAVCKETLRLYPIATEVMRTLKRPMTLGRYELPAGAVVSPCILLAHRDPALYAEPERFRPERFLERRPGPFEYLPFGGGRRRCVGAAFASFEMKIVLGVALAQYRFALGQPDAPRAIRRNITLAPEGGVPITLARRARRSDASPGSSDARTPGSTDSRTPGSPDARAVV